MKKLFTFFVLALFISSFSSEKVNAQYCTPVVTNCTFESITNVTFGGINHNSGCDGGYTFITSDTAKVTKGQTYTLSVTISPDDANEYITAWIDWNGNESFSDPWEEYILAAPTGSAGPHTFDVTVPGSAAVGLTRLRVMLRWNAIPTPCANYTYGEVEDYLVLVENAPASPTFSSNPASHNFGNVNVGSTAYRVFTFSNTGSGDLVINNTSIFDIPDGNGSSYSLEDTNSYPVTLSSGDFMYVTVFFQPDASGLDSATLVVTDNITDAVNEIPLAGTAIQGNFGGNGQSGDNLYFFANSLGTGAPSQPTFDWRSTATATHLCEDGIALVPVSSGTLDDGRWNLTGILPVGHSIKFFGNDYSDIYINTNGVIGFVPTNAPFTVAASLPAATGPSAAIYALWLDLNMEYTNITNRVSYEVTADEVIITYYRAAFWSNPGTVAADANLYISFQVIIGHSNTPTQNSNIFIQYNWDETGTSVQSAYTATGLQPYPHIIGLQGANNAAQTVTYRNRHNTAFVGPIFGSSLAVAFGPDDNALPVDLIAFNSSVDRNNVTLNWTTAWEENNMKFDVQRRVAESNCSWTTVGSVNGSGTVYEERNYSYTDRNLVTGKYEYRLVQFDYDGNSTADFNLNQVVEVGIPTRFDLTQNYPNPFNPTTKIGFQIPVEGLVKLSVFDMSGREVATLVNESLTPGYYTYDFNATNLSSGAYFYRLSTANNVITKRMVLVK